MMDKPDPKTSQTGLTRRQALARLGLLTVTAYVAPAMLTLSQARASGNSNSSGPSGSGPSGSSVPTPPTPPTAPSNVDEIESDNNASDYCKDPPASASGGAPAISQRDYERASAAVSQGYAKPLNEIWADITTEYPGRIVGIEFTGFRWRPRYRLRAVSPGGRLETVIVSARTGTIVRIVGC